MENDNGGGGGGSYVPWLFVAVIVALVYVKVTTSTRSMDMYQFGLDAQRATSAAIEQEELRRDRDGDPPLTEDEISTISERSTLREYRKQGY